MTEKDQETDIQRDMKQGKLKLSRFGLGFELTGFTAFLSWAGMWLYSLLGLAAMAMITVPTDFDLRPSIVLGSSIDLTRAERIYDLCVLQGCGGALLGISIGYFIMNFFLRKRNKENPHAFRRLQITTDFIIRFVAAQHLQDKIVQKQVL